jgi:hypothetical protein
LDELSGTGDVEITNIKADNVADDRGEDRKQE